MTGRIEVLCSNYERQVELPWDQNVAGPQRVWFAVYPPEAERRLRLRLPLFEEATSRANKHWKHVDLTRAFAEWMAGHESREAYFANPQHMALGVKSFGPHLAANVREHLLAGDVDAETVVALSGVASLFGLTSVSKLVADVSPDIRGRLLVLFPGQTGDGLFKLLDATKGYDYHAISITAESGG